MTAPAIDAESQRLLTEMQTVIAWFATWAHTLTDAERTWLITWANDLKLEVNAALDDVHRTAAEQRGRLAGAR